jgi:hypothetical protein
MSTEKNQAGAKIFGVALLGLAVVVGIVRSETAGITASASAPAPSINAKMENAVQETYEELMRLPQNHIGELVRARGKVIQVMREGSRVELRVEITHKTQTQYFDLWDDVVLVSYYQSPNEARILENDIVNFWGKSEGTITYKAIFGNTVEVPSITAYGITKEDAARSET